MKFPLVNRWVQATSLTVITLGTGAPFLITTNAFAVVLVQTNDPGFYNNNIGTVLNLSNTGVDDANEPFPLNNDSTTSFPTAPDLSTSSAILGNWLTNPLNLNSNWSSTPISVPNRWAVGTEVGVIYQFDTLSATNVVARFGVDNGIFVWLDGTYLFGARAGGSFSLGEYELNLGDFDAGTHYLQLLLEDHGVTNGYAVEITADEFIPRPDPNPDPETPASVPEPSNLISLLVVLGIGTAVKNRPQRAIDK